ncbi:MAG: hypothetical protein COV45_06565 [Deltaproteobacteria bacterium CG11_big_fil_rev_8_21_14_0_20_47_16]|nr:MAG: hypothetical protein COV45_06565 [Deltaproteobacteria bacterium CG11_big_fil_rev_8_21_14_0_20_47_16]
MQKAICMLGLIATLGVAGHANAADTTPPMAMKVPAPPTAASTADKMVPPVASSPTPAPVAKPAAPVGASPTPEKATPELTSSGNRAVGQLIFVDPSTIKVRDWKAKQEWVLTIGAANVKSFKVGDKVTCTFDPSTKSLKTIDLIK